MNIAINIIPSFLSISLSPAENMYSVNVAINITIRSINILDPTVIGWMSPLKPNMNSMLNMLLPTMFPIAILFSPFFIAVRLVINSGRLVPIDTIVNPIRVSLKPILNAIYLELSTTNCAPIIIATKLIMDIMILFGREYFAFSTFVDSFDFFASLTKYNTYNIMSIKNINPVILLICQVKYNIPVNSKLVKIKKTMSFLTNFKSTFIVATRAHIPNMNSMLNMLLPTILLIAIALLPSIAAATLTAASGALVPNATTVKPIISVGTLSTFAMLLAPSTK